MCPVCSKFVASDLLNGHVVMCKIANRSNNFFGDQPNGVSGRKGDSSNRQSEGRDSTSMSNSDEPNFVIYYLIKEVDFLIENNNF